MQLADLSTLHKYILLFAIVFGLLIRIYLILFAPIEGSFTPGVLSAYGDELAHVEYTRHIIETGALPSKIVPITKASLHDQPSFENYQSPLYYIIHGTICRGLSVTSVYAVAMTGRLLSFACMLLVIIVGLKILDALGKSISIVTRINAILFLVLSGVFIRFSTLAGNEMLAWLMSGCVILAFLKYRQFRSTRYLNLLAFTFVVGLYSKLTVLVLSPLILALLIQSFRSGKRRESIIAAMFLVFMTAPLFIYNTYTFGSPVPLSSGFGEPTIRVPNFDSLLYAVRSSVFPWSELWRNWIGLMAMLPAVLLVFMVSLLVFRQSNEQKWTKILGISGIAAYVLLNVQYDQAEARYAFISWPAIVAGFQGLPKFAASPWLIAISLILPHILFVL